MLTRVTQRQYLFETFRNLQPFLLAEFRHSQALRPCQKLLGWQHINNFIFSFLHRLRDEIQPLLDPAHGSEVIISNILVMRSGIDHRAAQLLMPQKFLDGGNTTASIEYLRRTRMAQTVGIHLLYSS